MSLFKGRGAHLGDFIVLPEAEAGLEGEFLKLDKAQILLLREPILEERRPEIDPSAATVPLPI